MKLQLESYGKIYSVETENDDLDIYEYLELFQGLLLNATFRQEVINNGIKEIADGL